MYDTCHIEVPTMYPWNVRNAKTQEEKQWARSKLASFVQFGKVEPYREY
jgi:hypothetical protein